MKYGSKECAIIVSNLRVEFGRRFAIDCDLTDEQIWETFQRHETESVARIMVALGGLNALENLSPPIEIEPPAIEEAQSDIVAYQGELVIDVQRGVIYFHDAAVGITRLRICGLDAQRLQASQIIESFFSIDITKPERVGYSA